MAYSFLIDFNRLTLKLINSFSMITYHYITKSFRRVSELRTKASGPRSSRWTLSETPPVSLARELIVILM